MIYLDNTQDLQEVWVPRNDGIRATRDDCFSSGYDSGYTDGYNEGRQEGVVLQEKDVEISSAETEVRPDDGYDGLSAVRIDAGKYGETMRGEGYQEGKDSVMEKIVPTAVTMAEMEATFVPGDGIAGFSSVAVDALEYGIIQYRQGQEYGDAAGYERGFTEGQDDITSNITSAAFTENGEYTATREAFARFYGGRRIISNEDNAVHALEMTVILYEGASGIVFNDNADNRGEWEGLYQGIRAVSGTGHNLEFRDRGCTAVATVAYGVPHLLRMSGTDMSVDGVPLEVSGTVSGEPVSRSNAIGYDLNNAAVGKFRIWTADFSGWDSGPYWEYTVRKGDYSTTFRWVWEERTQERPNDAFQTYGTAEGTPMYMEYGTYGWSAVTVDVPSSEPVNNQTKAIEITANTSVTVTYDSGYTGLEKVDIEVSVPAETVNNQSKTVTVSADTQSVTYDEGYTGLESVDIDAAEYGNSKYEEGKAAVPLQEKSAVMTASVMEVLPDGGYSGMSKVSIDAAEYAQGKYQDGYDAGNEAGYESGHTAGYSEGQEAGKSEVMAGIEATAVTVTAGTMTVSPADGKYGFSEVDIDASGYGGSRYQEGYESGHTAGYESGHTAGYQEGYEEGDSEGYNEGYAAGGEDTLEEVGQGAVAVSYDSNGTYYASVGDNGEGYITAVTVNVAQSGTPINNQSKSVSITANGVTNITYDSGYTGLESVEVNVNVPQSEGTGKIKVKDYPGLRFGSCTWTEIPDFLDFEGADMTYMFSKANSLTGAQTIDLPGVTIISDMFNSAQNITALTLTSTDEVEAMNGVAYYCRNLESFEMPGPAKLTRMDSAFYYCTNLKTVVLPDTSKVTDMNNLFWGCKALTGATLNTDSLTQFYNVFYQCSSITEIHLTSLSNVSTILGSNFTNCSSLEVLTVTEWPDIILSHIGLDNCPLLTHGSIVGLLNALPQSTNGYSFQIGETNIQKLTEDEIAIATDKGWTLV